MTFVVLALFGLGSGQLPTFLTSHGVSEDVSGAPQGKFLPFLLGFCDSAFELPFE
jgi:hypothetical protein